MNTRIVKTLAALALSLLLSACGRIDTLLTEPPLSPGQWLAMQPAVEIGIAGQTLLIMQPSSSIFVGLAGLLSLVMGLNLLRGRSAHIWGAALSLLGLGALLAGVSYQAFSYQIKCAGRAVCLWTSPWEIAYLALSILGLDLILIAQAQGSPSPRARRGLCVFALVHSVITLALLAWGAWLPQRFLISFEFMAVSAAPTLLICIAVNAARYRRAHGELDRVLLIAWGWLIGALGLYFGWLASGLSDWLWGRGVWFTENDVLHLSLLACLIWLARRAAPLMKHKDNPTTT